jgi:phosphate-selective porin
VAGFPVFDSTKNEALHVGFSTNITSPEEGIYQLNVENETHTGGTYIKSGKINNVKHVRNMGSEFGYSYKRFTLQSEYMHSFVRIKRNTVTELTDPLRDFNSFYAMGSFFIGNGQRKYDQRGNKFSSISVDESKRNVWEFALRYSRIHLRESVEDIKKMSDVTLGVNWYYSESMRVMFNYVRSRIENRYTANAFQMRLQATF